MSSKKLREFISQVKNGGMAKASHYFVELNLPKCLKGEEPIASNKEKIALFCEQTEIPGVNLDTTKVRTYGETRESVYDKVYDTFTMSFYMDNDFIVKQMFDTWIDKIYNPLTRHLNYPEQYITDKIRIFVQDTQDRDRYVVTLHEAHVKTVAPMQLNYGSRDILRLNVTFVYKYASYERYGYGKNANSSIIGNINGALQDVRANGLVGALSGRGNFDYGFSSSIIPKDYFSSFSSFQENYSLKSNSINELSNNLDDLSGTEFI
jgi:hypothetical protein